MARRLRPATTPPEWPVAVELRESDRDATFSEYRTRLWQCWNCQNPMVETGDRTGATMTPVGGRLTRWCLSCGARNRIPELAEWHPAHMPASEVGS